MYRQIVRTAVEAGGALLTRAVARDIGMESTVALLGALMKSGGL